MSAEVVERFCAVTGADAAKANQFLSMCENNLEMAVSLYMDSADRPRNDSNSNDNVASDTNSETVRAPIPQRSEVLVPSDSYSYYSSSLSQMRRNHRLNGMTRSAFSGTPLMDDSDEEADSGGPRLQALLGDDERFRVRSVPGASSLRSVAGTSNGATGRGNRKRGRLETLFQTPTELIFKGTFKEACETGKTTNRWLLVTIHDNREFSCHRLNRDVWKNESIRELIKESFIFWQVDNLSAEGIYYTRFYPHTTGPYIAVIDPVTRELRYSWNNLLDPSAVCLTLRQFLTEHGPAPDSSSQDTEAGLSSAKRPRSQLINEEVSVGPSTSTGTSLEPHVSTADLTEEEQLEMALEASKRIAEAPKPSSKTNGYSVSSPVILDDEEDADDTLDLVSDSGDSVVEVENWHQYLGASTDTECKLMIRLPSGEKDILTLPLSSQLKAVILYLEEKGYSRENYELIRTYPRVNLSDLDLSSTLSDAQVTPKDTVFLQER